MFFPTMQAPDHLKGEIMKKINYSHKTKIKRATLLKILVPNMMVLWLIMGIFYYNSPISEQWVIGTWNTKITSTQTTTNNTTNLEQKITETEKLLNDLEQLTTQEIF